MLGALKKASAEAKQKAAVDGVPFIMSDASRRIRRPGPLYGGDNDYVFGEVLGLSPTEIAQLRTAGVIA